MKTKPLSQYKGQVSKLFVLDYMSQMVQFKQIIERYAGILEAFQHPIELIILANTRLDGVSKMKGKNVFPFRDIKHKVGIHTVSFQSPLNYADFLKPAMKKLFGNREIVMPNANFFSSVPWAQDPFSVLTTEDGDPILLDPWYNDLYFDYQLVGRALAGQMNAVLKPTPLYLSGGNILQAEEYIIVGEDVLRKNQHLFGLKREEVLEELKKTFQVENIIPEGAKLPFQRELNCFQGFFQPLFHLDMYTTLGGPIEVKGKTKELIFVGELEVVGETEDADLRKHLNRVEKSLNRAANRLEKEMVGGKEFEVVRIPLPFLLKSQTGDGNKKNQFLSFNNALVEISDLEKRIYLPQYDLNEYNFDEVNALRQKARNCYESHGFAISMVKGPYTDFSRAGGALHCITKVLERK